MASKAAPDILDTTVEEEDEYFILVMKWKHEMLLGECTSHIVDKFNYPGEEKNRDLEEYIVQLTKDQVKAIIQSEGQKVCDRLIENFKLNEQLKERYEDKNVLYKAKEEYTIGSANTTFNLALF